MSKWARKTDANQGDIVDALRKIGCTVEDMSRVGKGVPDLLVGFRGATYLLEVKNVHGRNKLEASQIEWRGAWKGKPVAVVRDEQEAILAVSGHG